MIFPGWIAYASFALLLFLVIPTARLSNRAKLVALAAALIIGAVPLPGGLPLAGYLRAFTDELAITTVLIMAAAVLQRLGWVPAAPPVQRLQVFGFFILAGLLLYPAALGVSMTDPYRWGYVPAPLIAMVAVVALASVWFGNRRLAVLLTLATLAYALRLKASPNYWDYLLDPLLVCFAVAVFIRAAAGRWLLRSPSV